MIMSTDYRDGYQRGLNAGWTAANYADAYGETALPSNRAYRRSSHYGDSGKAYYSGWSTGYAEGVEYFEGGLYTDGTPIERASVGN